MWEACAHMALFCLHCSHASTCTAYREVQAVVCSRMLIPWKLLLCTMTHSLCCADKLAHERAVRKAETHLQTMSEPEVALREGPNQLRRGWCCWASHHSGQCERDVLSCHCSGVNGTVGGRPPACPSWRCHCWSFGTGTAWPRPPYAGPALPCWHCPRCCCKTAAAELPGPSQAAPGPERCRRSADVQCCRDDLHRGLTQSDSGLPMLQRALWLGRDCMDLAQYIWACPG